MQFEEWTLSQHHEAETGIADKGSSPTIIHSIQVAENLVQIVTCTHAPFPVIICENIVGVWHLCRITLSFRLERDTKII